MFAIVLLAVIACVSAAPHYGHYRHHPPYHGHDDTTLEQYIERDIFDTSRFWENLNREMAQLDAMLADLSKRFPSISDARIEGNQYKVTISLYGFEEKDIAVKARKGLLIVQAVHKSEGMAGNTYLDVRTLPDCVDVTGSWTFENGVLTIVFPLLKNSEGKEESTEVQVKDVESLTTQGPFTPTTNELTDIDVGFPGRGDIDMSTNVLPNKAVHDQRNTVEATTYAVDLKDEVELLPINY